MKIEDIPIDTVLHVVVKDTVRFGEEVRIALYFPELYKTIVHSEFINEEE